MARARLKTKNKGGKAVTYDCSKCDQPIIPGQQYYEWKFRYGGQYRQHASHGAPKPSQLTQSKLSAAYSAIEACEVDLGNATCPSDVSEALQSCIDSIGEVRDEYQEAIDNMISPDGAVGQTCQESIENLESFMESLETAQQEADQIDWDDELMGDDSLDDDDVEEPGEDADEEAQAEYEARDQKKADRDSAQEEFTQAKDAAESALGDASF